MRVPPYLPPPIEVALGERDFTEEERRLKEDYERLMFRATVLDLIVGEGPRWVSGDNANDKLMAALKRAADRDRKAGYPGLRQATPEEAQNSDAWLAVFDLSHSMPNGQWLEHFEYLVKRVGEEYILPSPGFSKWVGDPSRIAFGGPSYRVSYLVPEVGEGQGQ